MRRLRGEDGQTTVEWLGLAAVVAAMIAMLVLAAPGLGTSVSDEVKRIICLVTGGDCAGENDLGVVISCIPMSSSRSVSLKVDARIGGVENGSDTSINTVLVADPDNPGELLEIYRVSIGRDTAGRVHTPDRAGQGRVDGRVGGVGELGGTANYDFPTREAAEEFIQSRQGLGREVVASIGGVTAGGLEQLVDGGNRGIRGAIDAIANRAGIDSNLSEGGPPMPDSVSINLDAGLEAEGSIKIGSRSGSGPSDNVTIDPALRGTVGGQLTISLGEGGSRRIVHESRAVGGGQVLVKGREKLAEAFGVEPRIGGGVDGALRTKTTYIDGVPVQTTLVIEKSGPVEGGVTGPGGGAGVGGTRTAGAGTRTEIHLDLTDPANLDAFEQSFIQVGTTATPKPLNLDPYLDQLDSQGIEVIMDVETLGDGLSGTVGDKSETDPVQDAIDSVIDVDRTDTEKTTTLRSITDRGSGQQIDLALCGS